MDLRPFNGFDITCGSPTVTWLFGDGTSGSGVSVTHVYPVAGTYHAQVTLRNSGGSFSYTVDVVTGPAQPKVCGTLSTANVAVAYTSASCSNLSGSCKAQEAMAFTAGGSYDFSCNATHTYDWDFGDGSAHSNQPAPSHTFAGAGTYPVKLVVSNGSSSATVTKSIVVGGSTGPGTGACPAMLPGDNVYIAYSGDNNCTSVSGNCSASKPISFNLGTFGLTSVYPVDCGTPSYSWDFGDGAKSTAANPSHTFTANGHYAVKLTFSNGTQTVNLTSAVNVTGGTPAVPPRGRAAHH
jgi:PKD repeat protein